MAKRKKAVAEMTERAWLDHADAQAMIAFARQADRSSLRVWRLLLAAFWEWQADQITRIDRPGTLRRAGYLAEWAETGKRPAGLTDDERLRYVYFARSPASGAVQTARGRTPAAAARLCVLLRDIFGNPFQSVALDPAWLTSDVLALAKGIYDERAFDRMPILADALQDAGCTSEDVLSHCRDVEQVHVRGCWVVDLLLGKA